MRPYQIQVVAEYRDANRDSEIVVVDVPDEVAQVDTFEAFTYAAHEVAYLIVGASSLSLFKVPRLGPGFFYAE